MLHHSGFKTSARSTSLPLATLKPEVGKIFHVAGRSGKVFETAEVGRTTKRGPSFSMNCAALVEFKGDIQPLTRDRKYQTMLGSWNSTAPNSISGRS